MTAGTSQSQSTPAWTASATKPASAGSDERAAARADRGDERCDDHRQERRQTERSQLREGLEVEAVRVANLERATLRSSSHHRSNVPAPEPSTACACASSRADSHVSSRPLEERLNRRFV